MKKGILSIAIWGLLTGDCLAQDGDNSFLFMLTGPGSRASAMGEAFTAVGGDAGAPYFNPANAAGFNSTEFSLMHVSYLTDASLEHFAVLTHKRSLRFGLGLYLGKTSDFERRSGTPTDEPLGTFDEHNFTGSVFWALPLSPMLGIGSSFKWAYQKLDTADASAFAVDFGATYELSSVAKIGAAIRNLGTKPKFISESFDLPREFRVGASYDFKTSTQSDGVLLASDFVLTNWGDKSYRLNIGGEYLYQNLVALRAGYSFGYESRGFSAGGGLSYLKYRFDYSYVPSKHNLSDMHRFTLRLQL
jgi:hypothetical protein